MGKAVDLTGQKFGRLTVVSQAESVYRKNGKPRRRWNCICDCGTERTIYGESLTRGLTLSCGCLQKERASECITTHGETDSRLYGVWCAMKRRCYNPNVPEYHRYGGRGIVICDTWREDYMAFSRWARESGYDESACRGECTLDRIDNDGPYSPDNCRWVTQSEQMNNVSYNRILEYNGEVHTVAEWAKIYDMPYGKLLQRLNRYGYSIQQALNTD